MPNCTKKIDPKTIEFSPQGRHVVEGRFDGGSMTSDAGVMLLSETDRRIGLTQASARCIPDPRSPLLTSHTLYATCCANACTVWRWAGRT